MAWLWIVSVGVTDVQFPVWTKDEYGQWSGPRRFETGRGGIRGWHEGLLAMLRHGQIRFDTELPAPLEREQAIKLGLQLIPEGDFFLVGIDPQAYRISRSEATLDTAKTPLPLYCPKVEALVGVARETFGDHPVTVLVLNTRRADGFSEAAREPVASGPVVARCLAERLGLVWVDGEGRVPESLRPGTSTWIDVLTGDEAMEDSTAQRNMVGRLNAAIQAWNPVDNRPRRIAVTTSGGMPPLKPLIERIPAICVGPDNVRLLDKPERAVATAVALKFETRIAEQETLRFHCVEALRQGDYAAAYGLARRAGDLPWALPVWQRLGPLLDLPCAPLEIAGRRLEPFALYACQIEAALCIGDVATALIRLGTFIDSAVWTLIARDEVIKVLGLTPDREDNCLVGSLPDDHELLSDRLLEPDYNVSDRYKVKLLWRWPSWLSHPTGGQVLAASAFDELCKSYNDKPRKLRNWLVHGTNQQIAPSEIKTCMERCGLIAAVARPFGQNFLSAEQPSRVLVGLGLSNLAADIGNLLQGTLNQTIKG